MNKDLDKEYADKQANAEPIEAEPIDIFREKLKEFEAQLDRVHELEPGELRGALKALGHEIKATPDLVFLLEDQELGTIAKAAMILTGTKAKLEAKKKKKPATKVKKVEISNLDTTKVLF